MSRESELAEAIEWARATVATMTGSQALKFQRLIDAAIDFERSEPEPVTAELISEPDFTAEAWTVAALLLPQIAAGSDLNRSIIRLAEIRNAVAIAMREVTG